MNDAIIRAARWFIIAPATAAAFLFVPGAYVLVTWFFGGMDGPAWLLIGQAVAGAAAVGTAYWIAPSNKVEAGILAGIGCAVLSGFVAQYALRQRNYWDLALLAMAMVGTGVAVCSLTQDLQERLTKAEGERDRARDELQSFMAESEEQEAWREEED